ncbi:protein of unknown function [Rhodovastum atsumiense]|nr:protein of unknown function [Rhodovastum atsumiense]
MIMRNPLKDAKAFVSYRRNDCSVLCALQANENDKVYSFKK